MYNGSQEENTSCCRCGLAVSGGIAGVHTCARGCGAVCNTHMCNAGSCCSRRPLYLRRMQKVLSVKQWFRYEPRLQAHFSCVTRKVLLQTSTQKDLHLLVCNEHSQRTWAWKTAQSTTIGLSPVSVAFNSRKRSTVRLSRDSASQ